MKTLSIIALAGLATVATANPYLTRNTAYTGHTSVDRSNYVRGTYVFSFDDAHWDLNLSPNNTVFSIDLNAALGGLAGNDAFVAGIGWDINLETVGGSWLDEAAYDFAGQIFLTPAAGNSAPGAGNFNSPVVILADIPLPDIQAAGGILTIELFESFDDVAGAIDAFASGSLTLVVDYKVPTPAGLAVLGLGGLAAARRRR
jgi:hypothetical protein